MKRMMLLLLSILLLAGCAPQTEPDTMSSITVETTLPVEAPTADGDAELTALDVALADGKVLTLSVWGRQDRNTMMYGVREIRVYQGKDLLQTLPMAEAIEADGVDGIAPGYTESFSIEAAAELKDVDFDGNADLEICAWCPNNAIPYYYWLWNKEKECFEYAFTLQLRDVDTENRQLVAWYKVENGLYHTDYYRVNAEKELELLKREVEDVRP